MVTRRVSEVASSPAPIAAVVKRKRRASCLGEQERRERKRAIDREAQRSLREKTKTRIAELERTIHVLRHQDQNTATSSLLSEIDVLRAENQRLREVIDNVRSVVGCGLLSHTTPTDGVPGNDGGTDSSLTASSLGPPSPTARAISFANDVKPTHTPPAEPRGHFNCPEATLTGSEALDLDGMTILTGMGNDATAASNPASRMHLDPPPVPESPEHSAEHVSWGNDAASAAFEPMMIEVKKSPVFLSTARNEIEFLADLRA
ncbi:hypothetical protein ACEQ8H_004332 [Pleosporales sp. CAS-2024a]